MAVQTQSTRGVLTSNAPILAPVTDFAEDGNGSSEPAFNEEEEVRVRGPDQQTEEGLIIPNWIRESSLLPLAKTKLQPHRVCFFEPLKFCSKGNLKNGFCEFHCEFMFNVTLVRSAMFTKEPINSIDETTNSLKYTKVHRKLIKFPCEFGPMLIKVFTIPELCDSIEEFEQSLSLDLFAHLFSLREKNKEYVNRAVAAHKSYIVRVMRLFTNNNYKQTVDDPAISHNISTWMKNISYELSKNPYNGKFVFVSGRRNNNITGLSWLHMNKCSALTQMIFLLYELPYVQSPKLNYEWLSLPAAFTVFKQRDLVIDCTKASHGTALNQSIPAYGDPATLSYFRTDAQSNIFLLYENYIPNQDICYKPTVNLGCMLDKTLIEPEEEENDYDEED